MIVHYYQYYYCLCSPVPINIPTFKIGIITAANEYVSQGLGKLFGSRIKTFGGLGCLLFT